MTHASRCVLYICFALCIVRSQGLAHADEVLTGESADSRWLNNHEEDVPFFRTFLNTQVTVV
jgi:hypothetical protein